MRRGIALVAVIAALVTVSTAAGRSRALPRSALTPDSVAFADRLHGILGAGWQSCEYSGFHCTVEGTISVTSDGGRTWRVVQTTPRPVVYAAYWSSHYYVQLDDGETLIGRGSHWRPSAPVWEQSSVVCPQGSNAGIVANVFETTGTLVVCGGQPGAGNEEKAVYRLTDRGWKRVAYTGMTDRKPHGGISSYGYPVGVASTYSGFAIMWETRGTLYVTRDGGREWHALPKVSRPEEDFGQWATTLSKGGVGFVVLAIGGSAKRRLIETTDAGRTWRVVHRWR